MMSFGTLSAPLPPDRPPPPWRQKMLDGNSCVSEWQRGVLTRINSRPLGPVPNAPRHWGRTAD